ncbi:hypothetical protein, partial [Streptomyces lavendulae]
ADKSFAQWVQDEFGYSLPGVLDTLQIDVIRLAYRSSDKSVSFDCSARIELGGTPSEFSLTIDHASLPAPGRTEVHGSVVLYPELSDGTTTRMAFEVDFVKSTGTTLSLSWSAGVGGRGVPLPALLESLGFDAAADLLGGMPEALTPALTGASVLWERSASEGPGQPARGELLVSATAERVGVVFASVAAAGQS